MNSVSPDLHVPASVIVCPRAGGCTLGIIETQIPRILPHIKIRGRLYGVDCSPSGYMLLWQGNEIQRQMYVLTTRGHDHPVTTFHGPWQYTANIDLLHFFQDIIVGLHNNNKIHFFFMMFGLTWEWIIRKWPTIVGGSDSGCFVGTIDLFFPCFLAANLSQGKMAYLL